MKCPPPGRWPSPLTERLGFTLIELLVVIALIAAMATVLFSGLGPTGHATSLQSAQAAVVNTFTLARMRAMASGQATRILVHIDPAGTVEPKRFLRYLVVQAQSADGWENLTDLHLPAGVYVVPGNFPSIPDGLFSVDTQAGWVRSDGRTALRSTALRSRTIMTLAVNHAVAEQWACVNFAVVGSTAESGDLVLALGSARSPEAYGPGESPVELREPERVRGLSLSVYGVAALIDNRESF